VVERERCFAFEGVVLGVIGRYTTLPFAPGTARTATGVLRPKQLHLVNGPMTRVLGHKRNTTQAFAANGSLEEGHISRRLLCNRSSSCPEPPPDSLVVFTPTTGDALKDLGNKSELVSHFLQEISGTEDPPAVWPVMMSARFSVMQPLCQYFREGVLVDRQLGRYPRALLVPTAGKEFSDAHFCEAVVDLLDEIQRGMFLLLSRVLVGVLIDWLVCVCVCVAHRLERETPVVPSHRSPV
jgi:hypothetical protein